MNFVLKAYKRLNPWPFGNRIFTRLLTFKAPYFRSIRPLICDLRPGACRSLMKDRRRVRNHIGTVHAIAMCNLAELTAGLAVDVSLPSDLRWIPKEMKVQYLKKAKGTLKGSCEFDPKVLTPGDITIPFTITNMDNQTVFRADIMFYVSPR